MLHITEWAQYYHMCIQTAVRDQLRMPLSKSEQNYAQLEKEALSLIFGIKRFHTYLYGIIYTDHKPLTKTKQEIPSLAAARLQRWALILATYDYKIEYNSSWKCRRLPVDGGEVREGEATTLNIKQHYLW